MGNHRPTRSQNSVQQHWNPIVSPYPITLGIGCPCTQSGGASWTTFCLMSKWLQALQPEWVSPPHVFSKSIEVAKPAPSKCRETEVSGTISNLSLFCFFLLSPKHYHTFLVLIINKVYTEACFFYHSEQYIAQTATLPRITQKETIIEKETNRE